MIPVDQTGFTPGVDGNCFSACVASILEIPIADVPYFMGPDDEQGDWYDRFDRWCNKRHVKTSYHWVTEMPADWFPKGYSILSGKSPRGNFMHSVVALDGKVVHDPHPERTGVNSRGDWVAVEIAQPEPQNAAATLDADNQAEAQDSQI